MQKIFPGGDGYLFADQIFRIFDKDNNNLMDFKVGFSTTKMDFKVEFLTLRSHGLQGRIFINLIS